MGFKTQSTMIYAFHALQTVNLVLYSQIDALHAFKDLDF